VNIRKFLDMDTEDILSACDRYCARTGQKPYIVGKKILNDPNFFRQLAAGRSCRLDTAKRVMAWLTENTPAAYTASSAGDDNSTPQPQRLHG
jgi:hypothetical protein